MTGMRRLPYWQAFGNIERIGCVEMGFVVGGGISSFEVIRFCELFIDKVSVDVSVENCVFSEVPWFSFVLDGGALGMVPDFASLVFVTIFVLSNSPILVQKT